MMQFNYLNYVYVTFCTVVWLQYALTIIFSDSAGYIEAIHEVDMPILTETSTKIIKNEINKTYFTVAADSLTALTNAIDFDF